MISVVEYLCVFLLQGIPCKKPGVALCKNVNKSDCEGLQSVKYEDSAWRRPISFLRHGLKIMKNSDAGTTASILTAQACIVH